jgi:serine/threonine-protein kinase
MVLDFGVCKMDGVDTERLTGTGESIGTVAYMAPEQIRGAAKVDERADIYAFGVVVFEMLSGRLPHEGPSQMAILASKLEKSAARLKDCVRYEIPERLDDLVMQCLERDPRGRQPNVQDVLRQWRILARAEGFISGPSVPPPAVGLGEFASSKKPLTALEDEHPTEISKPNVMTPGIQSQVDMLLAGTSSDDESLPKTNDAPPEFNSMFPQGAPMSDAPMTTTGGEASAVKTGARYSAVGAIAGLLVLLCLFAFKFSRPDSKRVAATPATTTSTTTAQLPPPDPTVASSDPTVPVESLPTDPAPSQTISSDEMELPASSPATAPNVSKPRPVVRPRPRPQPAPQPAAAPAAASTPKITSQPRY